MIRFFDLAFGAGFGITLHAVANELFYKAGYMEILKPQGEYIGLTIMLIIYIYLRVKYEPILSLL